MLQLNKSCTYCRYVTLLVTECYTSRSFGILQLRIRIDSGITDTPVKSIHDHRQLDYKKYNKKQIFTECKEKWLIRYLIEGSGHFTNLLLKVSALLQQILFSLDQAAEKHLVQNQHRRVSMAESVQAYPLLLGRIRKDIAYPRRLYTDLSKIEPTTHPRIEIWVFVQLIKNLRHL